MLQSGTICVYLELHFYYFFSKLFFFIFRFFRLVIPLQFCITIHQCINLVLHALYSKVYFRSGVSIKTFCRISEILLSVLLSKNFIFFYFSPRKNCPIEEEKALFYSTNFVLCLFQVKLHLKRLIDCRISSPV